jgi:tetratricopeptide (TPR) repeat protein
VLGQEEKAKRCDLLFALAEALMPAGEPLRAATTVLEEAFQLSGDDPTADQTRICMLALRALLAYGAQNAGAMPEFDHWLQRADILAAPNTAARVSADLSLAGKYRAFGQWSEAESLVTKTLELARRLDDRQELWAVVQSLLSWHSPRLEAAVYRLAEEVPKLPRQGVNIASVALVLSYAGVTLCGHGRRREAEELWQEVAVIAERTLNPVAQIASLQNTARIQAIDGQLDAAATSVRDMIARGEELGSSMRANLLAAVQSRVFVNLGLSQEASEIVARALRDGREEMIGGTWNVVLLAFFGTFEDAQNALERMIENAGADENLGSYPGAYLAALLEVAVLLRHRPHSQRLMTLLEPAANTLFPTALICVARHLGGASALLGKTEEAREYYNQALEVCAKIRFRPEIALTRLELAELLLKDYPDERATAIEHLDFAIGEFREMKMQPSLERALRHRGLLKA